MRLIQEKRSEYMEEEEVIDHYPAQPPPPMPPPQTKTDIYMDPDEFAEVDQLAIQVRKVPLLKWTTMIWQLYDDTRFLLVMATTISLGRTVLIITVGPYVHQRTSN